MEIFKIREKPVENSTLIALVIALQAVFSILTTFVADFVVIPLIIILLIPLSSVLIPLYCKKNYYIVYIVSSLIINLAVSSVNLTNTIFYMVPSILVGFAYGLFCKIKLPTSISLFLLSLLELVFWIASLFIIKGIYQIDMEVVLLNVINKNTDSGRTIFLLFGYVFSLAQVALIHLFILVQSKYLGFITIKENKIPFIYPAFAGILASFSAFIGIYYSNVAYLFLGFAIYWSIYCLLSLISHKRKVLIALDILLTVMMLIPFAFVYKAIPKLNGMLLTNLFLIPTIIFSILDGIISKRKG